MTLLAVVFFLALTLGNAILLRHNANFATAHDFAIIQITLAHAIKYEWDLFIWREIAAFVLTVVVFSTVHWLVSHRSARRTVPHNSFAKFVSNRRR